MAHQSEGLTAFTAGKFANFVEKFRNELSEIGMPPVVGYEQEILPGLITALVMSKNVGVNLLTLVKNKDADQLIGFISLKDAPIARRIRCVFDEMEHDRRELLWRYAEFFLSSTCELIK